MDYAAPYKGNFISSIAFLEQHINKLGGRFIYLLPIQTCNFEWVIDLQREKKNIYFIDRTFFSKKVRFRNLKKINDLIKREKVDIIHTHFVAYNYTLLLVKFLQTRNLQIIGHFHNNFLPTQNIIGKIKVLVVRLTFDVLIGVSPSVGESLIKAGINKKRVTCISNAIDFTRLEKFETISISKPQFNKVVLVFGWPFFRKGIDIVLEAVKQLNAEKSNILLTISLAGGYEIFEKEVINQLGTIPFWVEFLEPRNDIATYYNACDIFLSAGREEGLNYSVIEAAYCKCLLIVSEIPGNPQDIPSTLTYEVENILQLKSAILELAGKSGPDIERINHSQKEYVIRHYDLNLWVSKIIPFYESLSK